MSKTLKLKLIGKDNIFLGDNDDCTINLCCTCAFNAASFTYTGDGSQYKKVAQGTLGSWDAVEVWGGDTQNHLYLVDATESQIGLACNEATGSEDYVVADTAQVFAPLSTTASAWCVTRTKADHADPSVYAMQLQYMQWGQGVVFSETATTIQLGFTTTETPIGVGTDVVAAGVCV